jgi:hypothetical protein
MEKLEGYNLELSTKSWRIQLRLFLLKDGKVGKIQPQSFHKQLERTAPTFPTERWKSWKATASNFPQKAGEYSTDFSY